MCGIGGTYIKNNNPSLNALFFTHRLGVSQENRGDFYSGAAWYKKTEEGDPLTVDVREGSFLNAFGNPESYKYKQWIANNKSQAAIEHNRYKTEGTRAEGQPRLKPHDRAFKQFALGHNGTMFLDYLIEGLRGEKANYLKKSTMDTEYARIAIATELEKFHSIPERKDYVTMLKRLSKRKFTPSYSLEFLDSNAQLILARDNLGMRPLAYFETPEMFAFASQTDALLKSFSGHITDSDIKSLHPGNMLIMRDGKLTEHQFAKRNGKALCIFEPIYFMNGGGRFEDIMVEQARNALGYKLGSRKEFHEEVKKDIEMGLKPVIAAVPGTGIPFANAVQEALYETSGLFASRRSVLIKTGSFRSFIAEGDKLERVKFKFDISHGFVDGCSVYLVDDSIVRGTTSKEITQYVKEVGGAKKVNWLVGALPNKYPCFYGINMPTLEELVASDKTVEGVKREIKADSLMYNTEEDMVSAVSSCSKSLCKGDFCTACFTGRYPTKEGEIMYKRALDNAEKNGWKKPKS